MDLSPDAEKVKKSEGVPALESAILNAAGVEVTMSGTLPATAASAVTGREEMEPVPMSTSTAEPVAGTDSPMALA